MDFLRHIFNPIIDKYVRSGKLSSKEAIEAKKMVYQAEEKFKFSAYGGNPANLVYYFKSDDFSSLIKLLSSSSAGDILIEVLEETKSSYSEIKELNEVIDNLIRAISKPTVNKRFKDGEKPPQSPSGGDLNLDLVSSLTSFVEEKLGFKPVTTERGFLVKFNNIVELKINVLKRSTKIELKIKNIPNKQDLLITYLEKVLGFVQEIIRI